MSRPPLTRTAAGGRALVLVDGINSFYDPAGSDYYSESSETVEPILALLARARADDCLVVHAVERHLPGLTDFEWRKLPEHCLLGERDSEIYP
ncbi:MAG: cysteine hydrolase family protein, partial [Nitrososphaerales archaeon]